MSDELTLVQPAVEPKAADNWKAQLRFDLAQVTARRIRDINKMFANGDIDGITKIYAAILTACPPEWGAPNDPESYLDRDFYSTFRGIVDALNEAGKNEKQS